MNTLTSETEEAPHSPIFTPDSTNPEEFDYIISQMQAAALCEDGLLSIWISNEEKEIIAVICPVENLPTEESRNRVTIHGREYAIIGREWAPFELGRNHDKLRAWLKECFPDFFGPKFATLIGLSDEEFQAVIMTATIERWTGKILTHTKEELISFNPIRLWLQHRIQSTLSWKNESPKSLTATTSSAA